MTDKTMRLGTTDFRIVEADEGALPIHADAYTEIRIVGSQLRISLASIVVDGSAHPELRICARLSIPLETLGNIQASVNDMLARAEEAKKAAN